MLDFQSELNGSPHVAQNADGRQSEQSEKQRGEIAEAIINRGLGDHAPHVELAEPQVHLARAYVEEEDEMSSPGGVRRHQAGNLHEPHEGDGRPCAAANSWAQRPELLLNPDERNLTLHRRYTADYRYLPRLLTN